MLLHSEKCLFKFQQAQDSCAQISFALGNWGGVALLVVFIVLYKVFSLLHKVLGSNCFRCSYQDMSGSIHAVFVTLGSN